MSYQHQKNNHYKGEFYDKKADVTYRYYTKKQSKQLTSRGYVSVSGEVGQTSGKQMDTLKMGDKELPVYQRGTHHGLFQRRVGYIECQDGSFLAVVKNIKLSAFLLMGSLALLIVVAVFASIFFYNQWLAANTSWKDPYQIDPNASTIQDGVTAGPDTHFGSIEVPSFSDITMPVGGSKVNMNLYNPSGNPCYFQYTFTLDQTGEVLYESDLVPPGNQISTVTFNRAFDTPGSYPATITYTTYALESMEPLNNAKIKLNINVG